MQNANTRLAASLEEIEAQKKKAIELVHVIGNTGMTGGDEALADGERGAARFWQAVAVLAMLVLIGVAVHLAFESGEPKWTAVAVRIFVAMTCGLLAAYAAREAAGHQKIERASRKMELELASIDPYVALLPEGQQHAIKGELAQKMFGQRERELPRAKGDSFAGNASDVAKLAVQLTQEAMKHSATK